MLAFRAARHGAALRSLLPAAAQGLPMLLQQERGMKLFELFNKEERAKRKAKLKEEMQRGYFDDFRDFRDSKGKVFHASERLLSVSHVSWQLNTLAAALAPAFPQMEVVQSDGRPTTFPPIAAASSGQGAAGAAAGAAGGPAAATGAADTQQPGGCDGGAGGEAQPAAASLVCLAFRAGAQPMLEAWAAPFARHFQGRAGVALYELAIVEGVVMRVWPFKQLLLRSGAAGQDKYAVPCRHLHHFGDMQELRKALHLTNLLTGYVFLVDARGRLRWRGSGSPSEPELAALLRCTEELLRQEQRPQA